MDKNHLKIRITGVVQGVSFRSSARQQAEALGVQGFARNDPDGTVYIEAEGPHERLQQFLSWCRQGSSAAQVETVEVSEHDMVGHEGFEKL